MFYKRLLSKVVSSRYVDLVQQNNKNVNGVFSALPFLSMPGPKNYPLIGQFNDLITIGSAEK
jgi:phospholipid N-methyltransferase